MQDLFRYQVFQLAPLNSQMEDFWLGLGGFSFLTKEILQDHDTGCRTNETVILSLGDHEGGRWMMVITDDYNNLAPLRSV